MIEFDHRLFSVLIHAVAILSEISHIDSLATTAVEFLIIMGLLSGVVNAAFAVVGSMGGHVRPGKVSKDDGRPGFLFPGVNSQCTFVGSQNGPSSPANEFVMVTSYHFHK